MTSFCADLVTSEQTSFSCTWVSIRSLLQLGEHQVSSLLHLGKHQVNSHLLLGMQLPATPLAISSALLPSFCTSSCFSRTPQILLKHHLLRETIN